MNEEVLTTKEKESLLTRAASLIVKNQKRRKHLSYTLEGAVWGFVLGAIMTFFSMVRL